MRVSCKTAFGSQRAAKPRFAEEKLTRYATRFVRFACDGSLRHIQLSTAPKVGEVLPDKESMEPNAGKPS